MSTIQANAILDASGGNTTTVNSVTPNADTVKGRNLIINGAMQVAQRGTSAAGVGAVGDVYPTVDRFAVSASTAGRLTMSQNSVTDLPGFANSLKLACTTADTSVAASEYILLSHRLEGQNLQQLKKGTSSAESVTVSFYVKGNANATYVLELYDNDNSRSYSQLVPVTSSWNRVSLTYSGDTTGALDNDNAISLQLVFWLHAGSTYSSGTLNTSWTGPITQANRAAGISSILDSTARTLEITGLKMEVGSVATEFDHRSYGEELSLCQRYFCLLSKAYGVVHSANSTVSAFAFAEYPVRMRGTPSITTDYTVCNFYLGGSTRTITALTPQNIDNQGFQNHLQGSGFVTGNAGHLDANGLFYKADAEL